MPLHGSIFLEGNLRLCQASDDGQACDALLGQLGGLQSRFVI